MRRKAITEIGSALIFALAALALLNPAGLWMPDTAHMLFLAISVAALGAFFVFVLREGGGDEREEAHRAFAGRAGFLAAGAVLLLSVVVESLHHALDPWLVVALLTMVAGKVGARLWTNRYR